MVRLSRAESQAQTRRHLVRTAQHMLLAQGYAATSLDAIADEAGFSKGAVYSNFRNKDALCREVLRHIRAQHAAALVDQVSTATTLDGLLSAFAAWSERTLGDLQWSALEAEFAVRAKADDELRQQLSADAAEIRDTIGQLVAAATEAYDLDLGMSAEDVATALLSLGIGLGLQRAIDPEVSAGILTDTIRAMLNQRL
ncbi:TetR family transcriptional regulator [Hoyosella sp. YIM 151337]|uniref:TetR/AcrR family transcriptional regulator n=1 Tax=Hoyosella sp. YIM 151337 TaxID=2992742 RepID=UPI0022369003|nr:TetR/AcrR family transcriptional regulator [Hoyosella sp. YIM 151337]MCW4352248.1 TetR family transcriptional regulator [Hoyosella sp. YIM 151337]